MDQPSENNHLENISRTMYMFRDYMLHVMGFLFFRFTRSLVVTFQKFTWAITGVLRIRRDAKRGLNFKQSAHVTEIYWRRKFLPMLVADTSNFITLHKGFKHPSYVLKPHVSLYCMTREEAVFVETPEEINIMTKTHKNMPLYQIQFEKAVRVITMPLASFHKIASDVGNPKIPVIWLSSTGHCGSTLLSNMFRRIPGMAIIAEPDVITTLGFLWKNKSLQQGEYEQLLASAVRLLCKPDEQAGIVCVKTRPCSTRLMEDIMRMFPKIRTIFMYRNSMKTVSSYLAMHQMDPAPHAMRFIMDNNVMSTILPFFRTIVYDNYAKVNEKEIASLKPSKLSSVGIYTAAWAAAVARCNDCREKGYPVMPIIFEDLLKDPRQSCLILFGLLDIRKEYLNMALEAFKVDAQRGTKLLVITETKRSIPQEHRMEANVILKKYGLPKLGERYEVTGLVKF